MQVLAVCVLLVCLLQSLCSSHSSDFEKKDGNTGVDMNAIEDVISQVMAASPNAGAEDVEAMARVIVGKMMGDISSLQGVPPDKVNEVLRRMIPRLRQEAFTYSAALDIASKSKGTQPSPMIMGLTLGLKKMGEFFSNHLPYLQNHFYQVPRSDLVNYELAIRCYYEVGLMCYDKTAITYSHTDICCPHLLSYM